MDARMVRAVLLTVVPMLVVATADGKRQNETGAITLNVAGSTLPSSSLLRGSDLIVDGQALKNPISSKQIMANRRGPRRRKRPHTGNQPPPPSYSLCNSFDFHDVVAKPRIIGNVPSVLAILNHTDEISADILCALEKIFPNIESTEIEPQHCSQLISIYALPEELHVLVFHAGKNQNVPFCDAQVYGAIPNVIEIRITPTKSKKARNKFITINLIGNGGKMRFDFEIGGKNVGKNFVLMWKTLISLVNSGRPYNNGIPKFHRREHMVSNPALSMTKYQFLEDSEPHWSFNVVNSVTYSLLFMYASVISLMLVIPFLIREVHLDQVTFVSDCEVEPEKTQEFSDKEIRSDVKPRAEQSQTAPNRNNTIISSMLSIEAKRGSPVEFEKTCASRNDKGESNGERNEHKAPSA